MKILIIKDGNNKIEKLIQKSEDTGYRILTLSTQKALKIQQIAEEKNKKIPTPLELNQYKDKNYKPIVIRDEGIIIDDFAANMEKVMEYYLGTNVKIGIADEDDIDICFKTESGKYNSTRFGYIPECETTAFPLQDAIGANCITINLDDPASFITINGTTIN